MKLSKEDLDDYRARLNEISKRAEMSAGHTVDYWCELVRDCDYSPTDMLGELIPELERRLLENARTTWWAGAYEAERFFTALHDLDLPADVISEQEVERFVTKALKRGKTGDALASLYERVDKMAPTDTGAGAASAEWAQNNLRGAAQEMTQPLAREGAAGYVHTAAAKTRRAYARVPTGSETCAFCFMLASRGFVYTSKDSALYTESGDRYHSHCDCVPILGEVIDGKDGIEGRALSETIQDAHKGAVEGYDPKEMQERWREAYENALNVHRWLDDEAAKGKSPQASALLDLRRKTASYMWRGRSSKPYYLGGRPKKGGVYSRVIQRLSRSGFRLIEYDDRESPTLKINRRPFQVIDAKDLSAEKVEQMIISAVAEDKKSPARFLIDATSYGRKEFDDLCSRIGYLATQAVEDGEIARPVRDILALSPRGGYATCAGLCS